MSRRLYASSGLLVGVSVSVALGVACSLSDLSREFGASEAGVDASATDASTGGGETGAPFCASRTPAPFLCDDFDERTDFGRWEPPTRLFGGALRVDTADSYSAPGSLLVSIPSAMTNAPIAFLSKKVTRTVTGATLSFAIKTDDARGKTVRAPTATITAETAAGQRQARVVLGTEGPNVTELQLQPGGAVLFSQSFPLALPSGTWTRVEMAVSFTDPGHVTVKLDDQIAVDRSLHGGWAPAPATANVGIEYASTPTTAFDVRMDNVVFDAP
jgi:hypothetical protein